MLGKIFDVSIKGPVCNVKSTVKRCLPFFYGYVSNKDSSFYRKKVYVVANNDLSKKHIKGQVIASAKTGGPFFSHQKLILAPLGHVFYASEIKNRFSRIKSKRYVSHISCLYEKSCGAIVFKNVGNTRYFLLVRHNKNKHWGFPKGHTELHESDEQTAKREIKEETNLDVEILDGFRQLGFYHPYGIVEKKVVIFLAKVLKNTENLKLQRKEIDDYKWATANEVLKSLRIGNEAFVFRSALKWLEDQKVS